MSDIKGQLIKNSYNYVLQSDLFSGIVYRIGGDVPNNPKFISGLTVNTNFTYSNGSEVDGYVLTCDASGNATWKPVSGTTPSSGVTSVTATNGISGNVTTGAITLVNTAPDQIVTISGGTGITTGGTYPNFTIINSAPDQTVIITGGTNIQISGSYPSFGVNFTGSTSSNGDYLPLSGGTVTGSTNFTEGLTANTISATTYYNLPTDVFVTGGTYSSGTTTITFTNNTGGTFTVTGITSGGGSSSTFTGGTVSGATRFISGLTANTISATTYYNLPTDVFVTGGTYTSGNAIFTNNTGGTFTVSGFATGGGGGQLFYLNLSQLKNGNRYLSTTASSAAEQSTGVTIADGVTGTIASFQSDQLNTILIPSGIWSFHLHSYKSSSNASFNIFVEVYKRTSGGTETLLFTTEPVPVTSNSPTVTMEISEAYFSGSPIVVTDSVVAVIRATNTDNQSHTLTFFTEGSQHYSYVVSTLQTQQGLTCDTLSGCSVIQTIQTNVSNKYDKSGGTITGNVIVQNGLTATTISATTYQGLPFSGTVNGNGTTNFLPKWTGTTGLGNSQIRDDGTYIGIGAAPFSNYYCLVSDLTTASTASFRVETNSNTKKTISAFGGGTGVYSQVFANGTSKGFEGIVTNGTNAYGFHGLVSPDENTSITNGIGGYFEVSDANGYGEPTNKYSLQLLDGTEGLNKVLTSVTSDGKANWETPKTNGSNLYLFYNY